MPTKPASDLRFEATDDIAYLTEEAMTVFVDDVVEKKLPVPVPHPLTFSKVAKTKDGRVIGGIVGEAQWNALEISHFAVHPDFNRRGVGTALMKCAEEAARGKLVCNQIHVSVLSWQPREFFEKVGYKLQWTVENHPRGHVTYHMAKEWPLDSRDAPAEGYDGAATDVVLEDWDVKAATAQLEEWFSADAARHNVTGVSPRKPVTHGLKALHADGSLAAVCIYVTYWNMLYVHMLTVMKGGKKRGVGSAVLRRVDQIAREQNCDHVSLYTMSWQARPFYEKNGFVHMATQHELPTIFHRFAMHRVVPDCSGSKL